MEVSKNKNKIGFLENEKECVHNRFEKFERNFCSEIGNYFLLLQVYLEANISTFFVIDK